MWHYRPPEFDSLLASKKVITSYEDIYGKPSIAEEEGDGTDEDDEDEEEDDLPGNPNRCRDDAESSDEEEDDNE